MSNYLRLSVHELPFDGDTVLVTLKPLKLKHALRLGELSDDPRKAVEVFSDILPEYIESLKGLRDSAGNAISVKEVCEEVYFSSLLADIGRLVMRTANVKDPQPPGASSDA